MKAQASFSKLVAATGCATLAITVQAVYEDRAASSGIPSPCALTDCSKLPYLDQCSPAWYTALNACTAPPCNIRYARNPAIDCDKYSYNLIKPTTTATPQPTSSKEPPVYNTPKSPFCKVPECSKGCLEETLSSDGCAKADTACHCTKFSVFMKSYRTCVLKDCGRDDQIAYLKVLLNDCSAVGRPVNAVPSIAVSKLRSRSYEGDIYGGLPDAPNPQDDYWRQSPAIVGQVSTSQCGLTLKSGTVTSRAPSGHALRPRTYSTVEAGPNSSSVMGIAASSTSTTNSYAAAGTTPSPESSTVNYDSVPLAIATGTPYPFNSTMASALNGSLYETASGSSGAAQASGTGIGLMNTMPNSSTGVAAFKKSGISLLAQAIILTLGLLMYTAYL